MSEHFLYTVTNADLLEVRVDVEEPLMHLFGGVVVGFTCKVVLTNDRGTFDLAGEMCFWDPKHMLKPPELKTVCTVRLANGDVTLNGNRVPKRIPMTVREAGILAIAETQEAKDTDR